MKILAYNLPAFHRIPENDEWWGKGFTERDNVRRGKPLFKGHIQPMIPYGNYYYDLSKKEDVLRQAELAEKYGIYGFVYYHYWFNGKMLLQKPVEIYRESKNANLHYCFCWANEQRTRTRDGKDGQVLMPQTFGGVEDWENHLQYFLNFFKDNRYIKRNNMPLLFVYSTSRIPKFDDMMAYWNKRVKEYGYDGIFLVELLSTINPKPASIYSKAVTEFEPMFTCRFGINDFQKAYRFMCKKFKFTEYLDYDDIWHKIIKKNCTYNGREIILSGFTNWDNTPRKSKAGLVIKEGSPEKFGYYLNELLRSNRVDASSEYCIINAWNEWGEGAILEPSVQYNFKYLEVTKDVIFKINEGKE